MPEAQVLDPAIDRVRGALQRARSVVALTGAGISAESGIPTFRDTMAGLWKEFDPATLATPEAFEKNPAMVTRWYDQRRLGCAAAQPNPGHLALVALEHRIRLRGGRFTLLTQNVDRLHQRAGSQEVVELHGNIMTWRCTRTGREVIPDLAPFAEFPPRSAAGAPLRPCVVWFGEMLPEEAVHAAAAAVSGCDLFLSIGTSSVVYPAATYIHEAGANGAFTVEVNPTTTPISLAVDVSLRGTAGALLPQLLPPS